MTQALPSLTIPEGPEALTPEWLTAALRGRGVLDSARVVSLDREVLGQGEGFVGTLARVHLGYDAPEPGAPASLIAKFPIAIRMNRRVGEMLGAYEREIRFYDELAAEVDLATPRCFYSAFDPNPMEGREQEALDFLERFPQWLVRLTLPVFLWLAGRSPRRYVLLIEDMAPRRFGDQLQGCDAERAEQVLRALARFHASMWGDERVAERVWVAKMDVLPRFGAEFYRRSRPIFKQRYGPKLPPRMLELVDWLEGRVPDLLRRLASCPSTLLHTDYRLDNLCFDESGNMTVLDWQGPTFGPGEIDLAYFITGNVPEEIAVANEERLIRAYHDELVEGGVTDHALAACRHNYDVAKLWVAMRMIPADQMDFEQGRGPALIETWLGRLAALMPEDYTKLLD